MDIRYLLGFFVLSVVTSMAFGEAIEPLPENTLKVLLPGIYHGEEVAYSSGSGWFALVLDSQTATLESVDVQITEVFDPVMDADELQEPYTGKQVGMMPLYKNALLLSGSILKAGPLVLATMEGEKSGVDAKRLSLGDQHYTLRLNEDCGVLVHSCQWLLTDGKTRQTLHNLIINLAETQKMETDSANTGIIWTGDLDRDGRLDLILDVSNHYNAVAQVRVYLSSLARKGELVGEAGQFSAVGC